MAKKPKRNIEDWEAALIKALLAGKAHTRDQIVAYFTRPDRTINPFRLAEIEKSKTWSEIAPADDQQVSAFLQSFQNIDQARQSFFEQNPLHPVSLKLLLRLKDGTDELLIEETDRFECKESLNFNSKSLYARLIAALANARGGVILFGVRDADRRVVGIKAGKLAGYDPAKLNQYLSSAFAPVPLWHKGECQIAGKTVGVIFVPQAEERPLICLKDEGDDLREGDIYYRYPGENRRIKPAELSMILRGRSKETERRWSNVLHSVERAGVENVAILNTASGEVAGHSGRFLIDQSLIPHLKFISEGRFSESEGAPTLKLLGNLQPLQAMDVAAEIIDHVHITDDALIDAFVAQALTPNPRLFLEHTAYSAKVWLPLFYFVRQAGLTDAAAAEILEDQPGAKHSMVLRQVGRLKAPAVPAGAAKPANAEPERTALLNKQLEAPRTEDECMRFTKAVRTLACGEVDPEYLLPLLKACWEMFKSQSFATQIQYAVAHVDTRWHEQELAANPALAG